MTHDGQPRAVEPDVDLDRIDDELEGETVVVDRGWADREFADEDPVGDTVLVDRSAGRDHPAAQGNAGAADADGELEGETVVVDRRARGEVAADDDDFADQDTFIVAGDPDAGTPEAHDGHDDTVVVDRGRAEAASTPDTSVTVDAPVRRRRLGGRRTLEPAPLEPIDLRSSVRAVGAGAVEYYRPRQLPEVSPPPASFDAAPPAREPSPELPSIRRASRRTAAITLTALTAAVAVGAIGALAMAGLLIGG